MAKSPENTGLIPKRILDAIERMDYDVFNRRAYVSRFSKFADLPRSFVLAQAR